AILPLKFFELQIPGDRSKGGVFFDPISPSDTDALVLPKGYSYDIIRKWGDMINKNEYFGFNNDFVSFIPFVRPDGTKDPNDGLMFVNHEYPNPLFVSGYSFEDHRAGKKKTEEQIFREKKCVGFSIFRISNKNGKWEFIEDDNYNRRIDATSRIMFSGAAAGSKEMLYSYEAAGTLGNCSGGLTPWGTVLSGEENFQDYPDENVYRWNDSADKLVAEHYGWIVEIDPFDKTSVPKKRTSLGRFRHENVAISISKNGKVAAYMGDDKEDECVYKFISNRKFDSNDLRNNFDILDDGTLYAADFKNNRWLALDINENEKLKSAFSSQAEVLVNCDAACREIGATPCNRCEDIEINPADGTVFIAFTNNKPKKDYHGSIIRLIENGNDCASLEFTWEVFAAGGVDAGFSCPDNLYFDSRSNLWVLSDISSEAIGKNTYAPFKNNSLFMIPTSGENKGKAFRFASGPVDTEMCGACFSPDETTMFLSIQHPGETSASAENPSSRWPDYGNDIPRPAVVAISGF
ncbi:MAG: DUF839 domain-containing protein, partial [Ignavibacteria bacterium]|nr:DUF839 domain-containing protein [Ignavibacteria bacterium]